MGALDVPLLDALMEQRQFGVAVCDATGRLQSFNERLEAMVGPLRDSPPEEWAGAYQLFDATAARPLDTVEVPLARALSGERVADAHLTLRLPGQPVRHLVCTAAPLRGDAGALDGAVVIVTEVAGHSEVDIEEARRQRYRARMNRILDFAAGLTAVVNHQVRNPLAVMKGHLELLEDEGTQASPTVQRALPALQRAVDSLTGALEDLSEAGDMADASDPHLEAVDLAQIVEEAVRLARASRPYDWVDVGSASQSYAPATADQFWVRRAVLALIETVGASADVRYVTVDVAGLREEIAITVAPRARQDAGGPPDPISGAGSFPANPRGLGIPLADAVALAHGGRVEVVESGGGLTATLRLAREPDSASEPR